MEIKSILVTGGSGKIGRNLLPALVREGYKVRALQFKTPVNVPGVETVSGSMCSKETVMEALCGMDAVCHLATSKEDAGFLDTSVKGLLNLLDGSREIGIKQFILAGGDASLGIFFRKHPHPLNESAPVEAYPGYYALSKVMEEVMCRQYGVQYGLPFTILRFSWIQDEDDLFSHMLLQAPDFGFPIWRDIAESAEQKKYFANSMEGAGCLLHPGGKPYVRHVVGISDVVQSFLKALGNPNATGETFNIAAPAPFSYDVLAEYVAKKQGCPVVNFTLPEYYDFTIDINKARSVLGYEPQDDAFTMIDKAIEFRESGRSRTESRYNG
ncbi:MAG TPA: hypothetical protein DCL60_13000 [Armatimonadetes bacterium]|jgi:UDP-glucose 4-epimerase|nr:hypothetical protein [Armatimonadota bacterium]